MFTRFWLLFAICYYSWSANAVTDNKLVAKIIDCPPELTLAYHGDWYPYVYIDQQGLVGSDWLLLKATLDRVGCPVRAKQYPPKRSHHELQTEQLLLIAATKTPERTAKAHFSIPYRNETTALFYFVEDQRAQTLPQVLNSVEMLALNQAGYYGEDIAKYRQGSMKDKFIHSATIDSRVGMLLKNRIQGVIEDQYAGCYTLQQRKAEHPAIPLRMIKVHQKPVSYMFSRQLVTTEFMQEFNKQLELLLQQEYWQRQMARYEQNQCA